MENEMGNTDNLLLRAFIQKDMDAFGNWLEELRPLVESKANSIARSYYFNDPESISEAVGSAYEKAIAEFNKLNPKAI